jgi:hypothetical protein
MLHPANHSGKRYKAMTPEQFAQVVEAISQGRYSWACVLILRFVGYNPLHFIPYRTYSRLVKENRLLSAKESSMHSVQADSQFTIKSAASPASSSRLSQIHDLAYLETVEQQESHIHGGMFTTWFDSRTQKYSSPR